MKCKYCNVPIRLTDKGWMHIGTFGNLSLVQFCANANAYDSRQFPYDKFQATYSESSFVTEILERYEM